MNLTDLKQVLDERSDDSAQDVMHHVRLHSVRTRVRTRRRRRVAAWAACATVALAGIGAAAVVPKLRTNITPTPAASRATVRMIEGFPEYASGARVVAAKSAQLPQRRIELTIVPKTANLVVFSRCTGTAEKVSLEEKVSLDGRELGAGGCGGSSRWDKLDISVGKPATFVITITGAHRFDENRDTAVPVPDGVTFALAIGERIPFAQYPLPPRPSGPLGPLDDTLSADCMEKVCPADVIIRSDPGDPTRSVRRTVTWKTMDSITMVSRTPGFLHVRVNGVKITTGEWWDYEMSGSQMYGDRDHDWKRPYGLDPRPGDSVTIEVTPEHITGDWQVVFEPVEDGKGG